MSCIVGIADGKHVWMGADGGSSRGSQTIAADKSKVRRVGPILLGLAGYARATQAIHFITLPKAKDDKRFLWQLSNRIRKAVEEAVPDRVIENGDILIAGLIGYKGRLYVLDDSFSITSPLSQCWAVGLGDDIALGYLRGQQETNKTTAINNTLTVVQEFYPQIIPPFVIEKL